MFNVIIIGIITLRRDCKKGAVKSRSISTRSRSVAGSLQGAARVMDRESLSSCISTVIERALPRVKMGCSLIAVIYNLIVLLFAVCDQSMEVDASDL